jgi:transcription elongation factor GreA
MPEDKEYLTQDKYNDLKKEYNELANVKRKEIADSLEYAKSLGDLSENAEYHEAREEQARIEDRITRLEHMIKNAVIVSPHHSTVVGLGSTVAVEKNGSKDKRKLVIVGSEEADMAQNKISFHSPLGEALMGKKTGDTIEVKTPGGVVQYKIIELE